MSRNREGLKELEAKMLVRSGRETPPVDIIYIIGRKKSIELFSWLTATLHLRLNPSRIRRYSPLTMVPYSPRPNINKIGLTALAMAAVRAQESKRLEPLFHDPFAELLAGPASSSYQRQAAGRLPGSDPLLEVRTRFFDDFLTEAVGADGLRQVALLGAGMDARAFRLAWPPSTTLFELEQASLLQLKEELLASVGARPTCSRLTISLDLVEDESEAKLTAAGFEPNKPAVWLAEGLFHYLEEPTVWKTLRGPSSLSAPGSLLGADFVNEDYFTSTWTKESLEEMERFGAPWRFGTNRPEELLAAHGWEAEVIQPGEAGANFGRWGRRVPPRSLPHLPRFFFVRARLM